MIQKARSSKSKSLLRELESAEIILHKDVKNFFENAARKVVELRRDPKRVQTGAKALKDALLSYLEQQGEIKTINIWCRKIRIGEIKNLLSHLKFTLADAGIQGVLELHLQDREINSPHVQFVGTAPQLAEQIIAHTIVKFGFEDTYESAVNRSAVPAFKTDEKLKVIKTDKTIEEREIALAKEMEVKLQKAEKQKAVSNIVSDYMEIIKNQSKKILEILNASAETDVYKQHRERKRRLQLSNLDELLLDWKEHKIHRRR
jgi:hypothetical protein